MVIECFGLPGSGKTYFSSKYSKEKKIFYYSKYRYSFFGKIIFKLKYFLFCRSKYIKSEVYNILNKLNSLYKNLDINGIKNYIFHFFYFREIYIKFNEKGKKCIFDEGLVQNIVFLIYDFNLPIEVFDLFYVYFNEIDIDYYWFNTDVQTIKENIKKRNRHVCSIDELSECELDELFLKVLPTFNYIYEKLPINNKKEVK